MATTREAVAAGGGEFGWSLVIEGFAYIITNRSDLDALVDAYAGTARDQALAGLRFDGDFVQEIRPFDHEPNIPTFVFDVFPIGDDDTFGIAVWKSKPDFIARLTSAFEPTEDAAGVVEVEHSPAATEGTVYIGGRAYEYDGTTGTSLTIPRGSAGVLAPFGTDQGDGETMPWHHPVSPAKDLQIAANPKVTDTTRTGAWIGRQIGLYLHRIKGGVWDVLSEAERVFAGVIKEVRQSTSGSTQIEVDDIRCKLRETVLLQRQFRGKVREGLFLAAGQFFRMQDITPDRKTSTKLNIVASGATWNAATPVYELNEGYYTLAELYGHLNRWAADEYDNSRIGARWSFRLTAEGDGSTKTQIKVPVGSTSAGGEARFFSREVGPLQFMGFGESIRDKGASGKYIKDAENPTGAAGSFDVTLLMTSENTPLRVLAVQRLLRGTTEPALDLQDTEGRWVQLPRWLPEPLRTWAAGGDYGCLVIGEKTAFVFARRVSDEQFSAIIRDDPISAALRLQSWVDLGWSGRPSLTVDEQGDLEVRQLVLLAGPFSELVPRLVASVRGNFDNHRTYDEFPFGAGIPWALLGRKFLRSLYQLEESLETDTMMVVLDRPTKLLDVLSCELALRYAWWIFRDGGLQMVSPPTPNASTARHELTDDNKGAPPGDGDDQRTACRVTQEFLSNVLKVEFDRDLGGDYHGDVSVENGTSINDMGGEERAKTLKARNSYADITDSGTAVQSLAAGIAARMLPVFSNPLKVYRRTLLASEWFNIAPGDTVLLIDRFLRDPTTGRMGTFSRPGVVLR